MNTALLTTQDLADRLRTSPETVRYWRHIGYGPPGFRLGRKVMYAEVEVDRWLQQRHDEDVSTWPQD